MGKSMTFMCGLLICICLSEAKAQNLKTVFEKAQSTYKGKKDLSVKMEIFAFETEASLSAFYESTIEIKKHGDKYLYQYPGQEILIRDNLLLLVDIKQKQIRYIEKSMEGVQEVAIDPLLAIDTLIDKYLKETYLGRKDGYDQYRIEYEDNAINVVGLLIGSETGVIKQLTYHYLSGQFVRIDFTEFDLDPFFDTQTFAISNYIQDSDSRKPSLAYQDFQLIFW